MCSAPIQNKRRFSKLFFIKGIMKKKLFPSIIFLLMNIQTVFAQTNNADTLKHHHLLVKTDLLALAQNFLPADGSNYNYALSVEFKLKSRFSLQLSCYLYKFPGDVNRQGHEIIPEVRYYLKNQFIGMYTSFDHYMNLYDDNVIWSSRPAEERFVAIGALYGYQREFGRFIIEGRLGIGIANSYVNRPIGSGAYEFAEFGPYLDAILAINVGWKIF